MGLIGVTIKTLAYEMTGCSLLVSLTEEVIKSGLKTKAVIEENTVYYYETENLGLESIVIRNKLNISRNFDHYT